MIKFSLRCSKEHEFEAWFSSSSEFDRLASDGLLDCPACGDTAIEKRLMAPAVRKSSRGSEPAQVPEAAMDTGAGRVSNDKTGLVTAGGLPPQVEAEFKEQLRKFREAVVSNAENVGEKFPEEARKIHYGEAEHRGIYGQATRKEAQELAEEGVDIIPIPTLPEDQN